MKISLLSVTVATLVAVAVFSAPLGPSHFVEEAAKDAAAGMSRLEGSGGAKAGSSSIDDLSDHFAKLSPIKTSKPQATDPSVGKTSPPPIGNPNHDPWSMIPLQGKRDRASQTPKAPQPGSRKRF